MKSMLRWGILILVTCSHSAVAQVYWADSEGDNIARANQIDGAGLEMIVSAGHITPGIVVDGPAEHIYWSRGHGSECVPPDQHDCGGLFRSHLDGTETVLLIGPLTYGALSIDLDMTADHMYWTGGPVGDLKAIRRANLDGTSEDILYENDLGGVWGLALDLAEGKMYWTEPSAVFPRIRRANLDGSMVETLLDEAVLATELRDIAINPAAGKMYWAEGAPAPGVYRANLDGSGVENIVSGATVVNPAGLELYASGGHLYVTQANLGAPHVWRFDLEGNHGTILIDLGNNSYPVGVVVDNDCNQNLVDDGFEIQVGASADCDSNGFPDECGGVPDCNNNQAPDSCEVLDGSADDCNNNGLPDECEAAADCNGNQVPDICDIGQGASLDCNFNGTPDECEAADCDGDAIPDECAIASGASTDCNNNALPDNCDISGGASVDCDTNGIPDECEQDCNTNNIADACDIADGFSDDEDGNGVPDECGQCLHVGHCADLDGDLVRDDGCLWWECDEGQCHSITVPWGDMVSQHGGCHPDGAADGNDRFAALNCFANQGYGWSEDEGYPCEPHPNYPPVALNVDTAGAFGSCQPDGVCDGNDAFGAMNAFAGETTCSCPTGPVPQGPAVPDIVGRAGLALRGSRPVIEPGAVLDVEVWLTSPVADLRGYQLHLGTSGGRSGSLELVDISLPGDSDSSPQRTRRPVRDRAHLDVFPKEWQAFSLQTHQVVVGRDSAGVDVEQGLLATFTYRVSDDAAGAFTVDVLHDPNDDAQRTFLFPTTPHGRLDIVTDGGLEIEVRPRIKAAG